MPINDLTPAEIKRECELVWEYEGLKNSHHITVWSIDHKYKLLMCDKGNLFELPPEHKGYRRAK